MSSISGRNLKIAGVVWAITLAVFALAYLLVLKPQKAELSRLNAELNQKFPDGNIDEAGIQKLEERAGAMKAQLNEFTVPLGSDIQNLATTELLNIARTQKLDSFYIKPWSGDEVAAFKDCKYVYGQFLKVSFNSTYNDFAEFLNILEKHNSVIFVDSFVITRTRQEDLKADAKEKEKVEEIKHKVEMNLAVLIEKQPAKSGQI